MAKSTDDPKKKIVKIDPKSGREYSPIPSKEKMTMKKTLVKNVRPAKAKAKTVKVTKVTTMKSQPKSVQKPMGKSKTIKADSMTEKEVMQKKKSFETRTGKPYISKDETYNKLERKLGRKPTVAEYNKNLK